MSITITILIGSYIPGYKAGGPVRSIENMISAMGEFYHFRVITADRDLGDKNPYDSIITNAWNIANDGKTEIFYATDWKVKRKIIEACNEESDLFYICGIFNKYALKSLFYKKNKIITKPIMIAPMGSLTNYALSVKKVKKQIYIYFIKKMDLVKDIYWSASSQNELEEITRQFEDTKKIYIIQDFVKFNQCQYIEKEKFHGKLNLIFVSRIHPKKNLEYILNIIKNIRGDISMRIYGAIEDKKYWENCMHKIQELPANLQVQYCGVLCSENIVEEFFKYHLFLFPTQSENFGHVIYESLCGSCPVIISNKTPWTQETLGLAGIVLPLEDEKGFQQALQKYVDMDFNEYNIYSRAAYMCSKKIYQLQNDNLFNNIMESICDFVQK